jgi:hypothetical protein
MPTDSLKPEPWLCFFRGAKTLAITSGFPRHVKGSSTSTTISNDLPLSSSATQPSKVLKHSPQTHNPRCPHSPRAPPCSAALHPPPSRSYPPNNNRHPAPQRPSKRKKTAQSAARPTIPSRVCAPRCPAAAANPSDCPA